MHSRKGNKRKQKFSKRTPGRKTARERALEQEVAQLKKELAYRQVPELRKVLNLRVKKRKYKYIPMPAIEYKTEGGNDFSQMGFGRKPTHRTREEWAIEHNPTVQENVINFITELGVLPPEDLALVAAKIRTLGPEALKETLKAWSPERYEEAYGSDGIVEASYAVGGIQQLIKLLDIQITEAGEKAVLQFDQENELAQEEEN